jgi:hypothetical protein
VDEMIWAFTEIANKNDDGDDEFFTDNIDWDGLKAYHDRINKGTTLFGKHYRSLWD